MKKFKFTLQPLLNVKNSTEKQQKGELAEANAKLNALVAELEDLKRRFAASRDEFNRKAAEGIQPYDFLAYNTGFQGFKDAIDDQLLIIKKAETERDEIQERLVETMKERRMLEKLMEKQWQEYLLEEKKESEKVIDDYMTNKVAVV